MCIRNSSIAVLLCALAPAAQAMSSPATGADESAFFRAYYLEHEQGDLKAALALYEEAATSGPHAERARAAAAAGAIAQELVASDFARLMPPDAIVYAEVMQPGEALSGFVSQLGLLGSLDGGPERYKISPLLISSLLGLRGAAVALTEVDMQGGPPEFVAIFHPGDVDVVRGVIETVVPSGGTPVDPIGSLPTWSLEGQALLTLTSNLVVVSSSREQLEGVVRRLEGDESSSLATNPAVQPAMSLRGDDLAFVCVNAEPVLPMLRKVLNHQATGNAGAAMAIAMMDIKSFRTLAGSLRLGANGLALEVALDVAEGHHNMVFNMLRKPALQKRSFELIPDEVAFFLATTLNEAQSAQPVAMTSGEDPVVTMMDFGRELFGNIVDVAVFGLSPEEGSTGPLPDVAAIVRVNDPARSRALWKLILGMASQGRGSATMEPETFEIAGEQAERYEFDGIGVYLVTSGNEMIVSPSVSAITHTLEARRRGRSVLDDATFAPSLAQLKDTSTFALLCSPARVAHMGAGHMSASDRREILPVANLLDSTMVSLRVEHSNTRIGVRAAIEGVPDVSHMLAGVLDAQRAKVTSYAGQSGDSGHASDH
jgi:hypothetical protein